MRSEFQRYVHNDYHIVVLVETETKVERIQSMLNEMHIPTVTNVQMTLNLAKSSLQRAVFQKVSNYLYATCCYN